MGRQGGAGLPDCRKIPLLTEQCIKDQVLHISSFLLLCLCLRMISLFIFRRIRSKGIFPYHAFNSLFITGEFAVGKEADDYYDNENDNKVFHSKNPFRFYQKKGKNRQVNSSKVHSDKCGQKI